jgi:hypothetical protein
MARLETALMAYLDSQPSLIPLLGTPLRLSHDVLPSKQALPAVVIQRVSATERADLLGGRMDVRVRLQFTIHADTRSLCLDVAAALCRLLVGYAGPLTPDVAVTHIARGGERAGIDPATQRPRTVLDLIFSLQSPE